MKKQLKAILEKVKDRDLLRRLLGVTGRIRQPIVAAWAQERPVPRVWIALEVLREGKYWGITVSSSAESGRWETWEAKEVEDLGALRIGAEQQRHDPYGREDQWGGQQW